MGSQIMNVTVQFEAQVRRAAGATEASFVLEDGATIGELLQRIAADADEPVRRILVDDAGSVRSTLLVFVNNEHVRPGCGRRLTAADSVTITSPISGG